MNENRIRVRRSRGVSALTVASALIGFGADARAASPATQPSTAPATRPAAAASDDLDWLLAKGKPTEAPKSDEPPAKPTTQSASPFAAGADPDLRHGMITLSNGEKIGGMIRHTQGKPMRAWVEGDNEYHDVPFSLIKSIDAKISWERDQKEWHFKESGSDIKEYSGQTYPAREMEYTFTLKNGQKITGGVVEPLYVQAPDGEVLFALHKRDKGDVGKTLKQLVYVQHVEFIDDGPGTDVVPKSPANGGAPPQTQPGNQVSDNKPHPAR